MRLVPKHLWALEAHSKTTVQMEVVKDSRLKLLIIQILLNPNNGVRLRKVVSEYNAHIDAYDILEESFKLKEELKVMNSAPS